MHRLAGLFFAPAILFFALTGAVQTLGLHEGGPSRVPLWLADIASLHKHQRLAKPKPRMVLSAEVSPAVVPPPREHPALRLFVVSTALILAGSVLSGCAIALHPRAIRRSSAIMLVLGTLVPLALYWI